MPVNMVITCVTIDLEGSPQLKLFLQLFGNHAVSNGRSTYSVPNSLLFSTSPVELGGTFSA